LIVAIYRLEAIAQRQGFVQFKSAMPGHE